MGSENEVEKWKIRHFLKTLKEYRGTAPTGLITLPIPPGTQLPLVINKLQHEYGTATNIKSHTTTLAVQTAISTTIQRLKLYRQTPPNGLIIYAGNAYLNGKEKKVCLDIDPIKPVVRKDYFCSNHFDVSHLEEMLEDSKVYGFVIMDGNGYLMAKVQGAKKTILATKGVLMPKKQKKGGQSAARIGRERENKRDAYIKMVCEMCTSCFIDADRPNVSALIIGGNAEFKSKLATSDHYDPRLRPLIWKVIDISYGGRAGLDQAIEMVKGDLAGLPLVQEKKIVSEFFGRISNSSSECGCISMGPQETIAALEAGVVDTILIDENSELMYLTSNGMNVLLTEYLADHYNELGCQVHYITSNTGEGVQFIRGFNGLGALLKYDWQYYPPEKELEATTEPTSVDVIDNKKEVISCEKKEEKDVGELNLDDFFM